LFKGVEKVREFWVGFAFNCCFEGFFKWCMWGRECTKLKEDFTVRKKRFAQLCC
jgi:hypothetical protein